MAIYRTAQCILINAVPFTLILIFSDSQVAIKSLSNVANNSRIVWECRSCLNFLSGWFSVTLISIPGHCDIPENCRADRLARTGTLLPEFASIDLGMPLNSFKVAIARKFSRDVNLSWINEESCSTARLTWSSIDRRHTNQLLVIRRNLSFRSQCPCLQVTVIWVDEMWKECGSHLTTSAVDADPLKKRILLSPFSVNAHLLRGANTGYLAPKPCQLDGAIKLYQAFWLVFQRKVVVF